MTRVRCRCGQHDLTSDAGYVAFPAAVHTVKRCGRFVQLIVSNPMLPWNTAPAISVLWPDGSKQ